MIVYLFCLETQAKQKKKKENRIRAIKNQNKCHSGLFPGNWKILTVDVIFAMILMILHG